MHREDAKLKPGMTWLFPVLILAIALLRKVTDYDVWYHLAIGREIFQAHSIPAKEFLISSQIGETASFHEWGFELLIYTLYNMSGFIGLGIFNAVCGAGTVYLIWRAAQSERGNDAVALVLLSPFFWIAASRTNYRPEIILYASVAITIYCLERFLRSNNRRYLLFLPVVALVHSNLHPSVLIILIITCCYTLQTAWGTVAGGNENRRRLAAIAGTAGAMSLAALANPYGYDQILLPLKFSAQKELLNIFSEFLPTLSTPWKWAYIAIAILTPLALLFQSPKRLVDWLLFIFFGYLAFKHMRNMPLFALVTFIPLARGGQQLLDRFPRLSFRGSPRTYNAVLACVLLLGILLPTALSADFGIGPAKEKCPTQVVDALKRINPPGKLFNLYQYGGYLEWSMGRGAQVFIDGRHYRMDRALYAYTIALNAGPGWETILNYYGVTTVVLPATDYYFGVVNPLVEDLADNPNWLLYSAEPGGLLFIKKGALTAPQPILDKTLVWKEVVEESKRTIREKPDLSISYYTMGVAYRKMNDQENAAKAFEGYARSLSPAMRAKMSSHPGGMGFAHPQVTQSPTEKR